MARLTITGLYNYNNSVFDGFYVPTGMDKDVCITEILLQCAELEIIYPSFNTMKLAITNWAKLEQPIWTKLYNTEKLKYEPLWNVDANVEEIRNVTRAKTGTAEEDLTSNATGTTSDTRTITGSEDTSGTSEQNTQKPGYNSSDLVLTEKVNGTTTGSADTTTTDVSSGTSGDDRTEQRSGSNSENENVDDVFRTRRTGNIGVTSSQQLLQAERDVATFSTIKYIVDSFKKRFCLLVY